MKTKYIEFAARGEVTIRTEDIATDDLAPFEVVIRNEVSLVSAGTELSRLHGVEDGATFPARTGYASIGRILKKGEAVSDFEIGQRVLYAGKHASGQRFLHGQDHQWGRLYAAPESLAPEAAVFACLAEIAMTAPCVAPPDLNDAVAVFGLGLVGNLAAQLYKHMGAHVIALDPITKRCEVARAVGLDVVDVSPQAQVEAVRARTQNRGANICVDAVGHSAVIENCVAATALFGQVVLLGTPRASHQTDSTRAWSAVHNNGLVVRGAHQWRFPAMDARGVKKTVPWGFETMFDLIESGALQVKPLLSHLAAPDDAPAIYDGLQNQRDSYWGAVFDWREE